MNRRSSLQELLDTKNDKREARILALSDPGIEVHLMPEPYEDWNEDWYLPDMAIVRNKEKLVEDLTNRADRCCLVKYYLSVGGKRVSRTLHEQYCSTSDLFVDREKVFKASASLRQIKEERTLFVNADCSYVVVDDVGYNLFGLVKELVQSFVKNWRKNIKEVRAADICIEFNIQGHIPKYFREEKKSEIFDKIFTQPRHGFYSLSVSKIQPLPDSLTNDPKFDQTLPTFAQ